MFDFALSDAREEYTRGFRSTPGIVSATGVYLPGASGWYPLIGRSLMTFELTVAQPATWRVVSEGPARRATPTGVRAGPPAIPSTRSTSSAARCR